MPRTSRRESEDHSTHKKRRRESPSPRKDTDKSNPYRLMIQIGHRKRDEKREEKKTLKKEKSPHKTDDHERSPSHVQTRRMSSH